MVSVAEIVHLGTKPPPLELKTYIERLILSGRNGIVAVSPSPAIVLLARDLAADDGLWKKGRGPHPCRDGIKCWGD
jgi:hypothetical protein